MKRLKLILLLCAFATALALPGPAQLYDVAGNLLIPATGNDDPPGTMLKKITPATQPNGLTMIGDQLFGIAGTNIYEYDTTTGAVKSTQPLTFTTTGIYNYGLGYDVKRNYWVIGELLKYGILVVDRVSGKEVTFIPSPGDRCTGATYDPTRDWYWVSAWNTNVFKAYDANPPYALKKTITGLGGRSCGAAYSAVNDALYYNSRTTIKGYLVDPNTGTGIRSWSLPYTGSNNGQCSGWWDRWQCPMVRDYTSKVIGWLDAGYPRAKANATVKYGTTLQIDWTAGSSASKFYMAAASWTERVAGITFGNRYCPILTDWLFFFSLANPVIFTNFIGQLDKAGTAKGAVNVPNLPGLKGLKFSIAWAAVDAAAPFGIHALSGPWQVEITD